MAKEQDWMKVLGKAADKKGRKKDHIKSQIWRYKEGDNINEFRKGCQRLSERIK